MSHVGDRDTRARAIIERLGLEPHPERGYYRETYRASLAVNSAGSLSSCCAVAEGRDPLSSAAEAVLTAVAEPMSRAAAINRCRMKGLLICRGDHGCRNCNRT